MFAFQIHSPIQEITYNVPEGYQLFMKRDDLIDPLISGNKWRKLKYQVAEAHHQHKTKLVSFGGAHSNHLLALASASAKFGFSSIAFVRGEEARKPSEILLLCKMMGMKIIQVSRDDYKNKPALFNSYFKEDALAYVIDEGGLSALGAKGCEEIISELTEEYTDIFIAAGTACTSAGILNAIHTNKLNTHLHSVVVHNGLEEIKSNLAQLLLPDTQYSLPSTPYSIPANRLSLHATQEYGRYAQHTNELLEFSFQFQRNTGILLDPVYTAKALATCYKWMEENTSTTTIKKILFVHTGGLLGNLGKMEAFEKFYLP
jgi:1-aminocyclopropane-1-carboxylate deaminase